MASCARPVGGESKNTEKLLRGENDSKQSDEFQATLNYHQRSFQDSVSTLAFVSNFSLLLGILLTDSLEQ